MRRINLALLNGKVITFDEEDSHVEAVAISGNEIFIVGTNNEVKRMISSSTRVIDLEGRVALPGFIDAHTHFINMGLNFDRVDLRGTKSLHEALENIRNRVSIAPKGEIIVGMNWDESKWSEKRYISRNDLDIISPDHPVILIRIDGHMLSANTQFLELVGMPSTKKGVETDGSGESTGVFKEEAADYLRSFIPRDSDALKNALEKATEYAHKHGVTSIQDTVSSGNISTYFSAFREGKLRIRVYLNFGEKLLEPVLSFGLSTGFGNEKLRIGALKIYSDGSIGSRTAALNSEFLDDPGNKGMLMYEQDKLEEIFALAHRSGIQLAIHAIGDRAIESTLEAVERILKAFPREDHRHRIEHMELAPDEAIQKATELQMIASMQPNFIGEWGLPGEMYERRLGKFWFEQNSAFRKILDNGCLIAFGSDCMPFSPLYGIHWAVNAPMPSQRISVHEAIRCYTKDAAYASFEEDIKGSIERGKLADIIVLSEDPYENPERIMEIKVCLTIQDGRIVYQDL
ncbi:MAG: amidohydrolase [Candidatus Hodarchaeota archaeon]